MTETPFDEVASGYDTLYRDAACRGEDQAMLDLLGPVVEGRRVLDVGCGTGWVADHTRPAEYWGTDISWPMLAQAQHKHPGHHFYRDNMQREWEVPGTFEVVTSLWCSPSYTSPEHFATQAYARLRSGGRAFVVPHAFGAAEGDHVRHDSYMPAACYNGTTGWRVWDRAPTYRAFRDAGFSQVTVTPFRNDRDLPGWAPALAHYWLRRLEFPKRPVFLIVQGVK